MAGHPKIVVCGVPELGQHLEGSFTHFISIWDPDWEARNHQETFRKRLKKDTQVHFAYFHDIPSALPDCSEPTERHVREILDFAASLSDDSTILIHCWAGISRSTAVAYAILCQAAGPGMERQCLEWLLRLRPQAAPNSLIVRLADKILERGGAMTAALEEMRRTTMSWDSDEF